MSRASELEKNNTKASLIAMVIQTEEALASATSGPLTSGDLIKAKISLADKSIALKATLADIKSREKIALAKISQDSKAEQATALAGFLADYKAIEEAVEDFNKASESTIAQAEAEKADKLEAIKEEVLNAEAKQAADMEVLNHTLKQKEAAVSEKIATINEKQVRDLDQLAYDNKKALRDENDTYITKIAKDLGKVILTTEEAAALREEAKSNADATKAEIAKVTNAVKSNCEAKAEKAATTAKHESELTISKLQTAVEAAEAIIKSDKELIKAQAAQIEKIPTMIKEAVAASQTPVSITQDANKK